ncbi:MAG: CoA transferase [Desulfobacteraceae bacterium]|nr:CoA transferase [Desulfobacterales bacterium]MBL6968500.1 CoA transferase [Desulfobacteraceae bacterium]MBL7102273.1 CoA transferase [Desulfobacteraceae bacterium]MBL7174038.1 CoA transferase [Desulfobacteraceae bacterium]
MRPLDGIKVIEMAGLAPSPYCGMLLADFGADVVIVDRLSSGGPEIPNIMKKNPFNRGKRSMRVNLKNDEGVDIVKRMMVNADVLVEPYRPGVMESLKLGPDDALRLNPGLIYARLTGWGQNGAYASMAGHDINYIALSGALSLFRRKGERPLPPCNLLGDFAGGGMLCAMGILLALIERSRSGKGQIVDAAMLDGAANLSTLFYGLLAHHLMTLDIGTNALDSGAPFYQTYETADGRFMAVGAIEARFYAELLEGLSIDPSTLPQQFDMPKWPEMIERFAGVFKTKTRDQWAAIFDGKDACVAPVLDLNEVSQHPHNREREIIINIDGVPQPAPAPKLSRTPGRATEPKGPRGANTKEILADLGYSGEEIKRLIENQSAE